MDLKIFIEIAIKFDKKFTCRILLKISMKYGFKVNRPANSVFFCYQNNNRKNIYIFKQYI